MAQQILEADDHRRLQPHAQRLVDDVHDADAAALGERLHLHKAVAVDGKVAGTPALEPEMLLGLRG